MQFFFLEDLEILVFKQKNSKARSLSQKKVLRGGLFPNHTYVSLTKFRSQLLSISLREKICAFQCEEDFEVAFRISAKFTPASSWLAIQSPKSLVQYSRVLYVYVYDSIENEKKRVI